MYIVIWYGILGGILFFMEQFKRFKSVENISLAFADEEMRQERTPLSFEEEVLLMLVIASIGFCFIPALHFYVIAFMINNFLCIVSFFFIVLSKKMGGLVHLDKLFLLYRETYFRIDSLVSVEPKFLTKLQRRLIRYAEIKFYTGFVRWRKRLLSQLECFPKSMLLHALDEEILGLDRKRAEQVINVGQSARMLSHRYFMWLLIILLGVIVFNTTLMKNGLDAGLFHFIGMPRLYTWHTCLYFLMVTLYTVGYGDIHPASDSVVSQAFVTLILLSLFFVFYILLNLLSNAVQSKVERTFNNVTLVLDDKLFNLKRIRLLIDHDQRIDSDSSELINFLRGVEDLETRVRRLPGLRREIDSRNVHSPKYQRSRKPITNLRHSSGYSKQIRSVSVKRQRKAL